MTTETLKTIVDGLNGSPFNRHYSLVTFDSLPKEKLLQTLSDVLCWIEGMPDIDIRSESPDETAMRIMQALRILKYPPPRDIDHVQKWRLDIVEGEKLSIYPILDWIFNNVDRLKERIYLAKYLTKTEVPPEEITPEIQRIQNIIFDKMEEFKQIHQRIVESRADYARAEDIRADLKIMDEEKEQLERKIEKVKRITSGKGDLHKYLEMASRLRMEVERNEQLNIERQTQRNSLLLIDQRLQRLSRLKNDLEKEKESINPQKVMEKLNREIETNSYILHEKLTQQIEIQKKNVQSINKILNMKAVTNSDIINLKKRIDAINKEIIDLTMERDKKDEEHEDKLSIYRHQSTNIQRKKQNIAEKLQLTKLELEEIEKTIEEKKRDLSLKTGNENIITTVHFKRYIGELRAKTTSYKRKKSEMEEIENELRILQRTVEILNDDWKELKQSIESEGRGVIETLNAQTQRPKTAKPNTTNIDSLRGMAKELNERVLLKRKSIQQLKDDVEEFSNRYKDVNAEYENKKAKYMAMKTEMESEQSELENIVVNLEQRIQQLEHDRENFDDEMAETKLIKDYIDRPEDIDRLLMTIDEAKHQDMQEIELLKTKLTELSAKSGGNHDQIAIWKSMIAIFEKKIEIAEKKGVHDGPIGDRY